MRHKSVVCFQGSSFDTVTCVFVATSLHFCRWCYLVQTRRDHISFSRRWSTRRAQLSWTILVLNSLLTARSRWYFIDIIFNLVSLCIWYIDSLHFYILYIFAQIWLNTRVDLRIISFMHERRINSEALEYHDSWFLFTVSYFSFPQDDVIKWQHFPRYWPVVWGIHQSPVNSPLKGQWRGDLMSLHVYKFTAILIKPRMCYLNNVSCWA